MEGPHGGEAADGQRGDSGLGAAAEHHLGVAVPDVAEGVAHRVGAAGTGGYRAGAHALKARHDGNEAGAHVGDGGGDIEGGGPVKALLGAAQLLALGHLDAAHAAGDDDAAAGEILLLPVQTAVGQGLLGGGGGQLGVAAHVPHVLLVQHGGRVPVLDLSGQVDLLGGAVIPGDGANAAHPVPDSLPGVGGVVAQGVDGAQAGNQHSAFFHNCVPPHMPIPPSTWSTWPVMYPASSEAKKATAAATSSGAPGRPAGMADSMASRAASGRAAVMSVAM